MPNKIVLCCVYNQSEIVTVNLIPTIHDRMECYKNCIEQLATNIYLKQKWSKMKIYITSEIQYKATVPSTDMSISIMAITGSNK